MKLNRYEDATSTLEKFVKFSESVKQLYEESGKKTDLSRFMRENITVGDKPFSDAAFLVSVERFSDKNWSLDDEDKSEDSVRLKHEFLKSYSFFKEENPKFDLAGFTIGFDEEVLKKFVDENKQKYLNNQNELPIKVTTPVNAENSNFKSKFSGIVLKTGSSEMQSLVGKNSESNTSFSPDVTDIILRTKASAAQAQLAHKPQYERQT